MKFEPDDFEFGPDTYFYPAKVTNVVDGDTIEAVVDQGFNNRVMLGGKNSVRLLGIDCPESDTREGKDATAFTQSCIRRSGGQAILHTHKKGKYGRWLAEIWTKYSKKYTLNQMLALEGFYKEENDAVAPVAMSEGIININEAESWKLQWLSGVGDTMAERIIESRPYNVTTELTEVDYLSADKFEKISNFITV